MRGLGSTFAALTGVPREILADQLKAKDHRSGGGQLRENAELARFGAYWGFRIRA